jgi:hypothetical protein
MIDNPDDQIHMVNTMDLGKGIHPHDKDAYGRRLADTVLGRTYGRDTAHRTALLKSFRARGKALRVTFTQTAGGLKIAGGDEVVGFDIAAGDQVFFPASARIVSPTEVEVWHENVPQPSAVRYHGGNLVNGDGLQVFPFVTGVTPPVPTDLAGRKLLALLDQRGQVLRQAVSCLFRLGVHEVEAAQAIRKELADSISAGDHGSITRALMTIQHLTGALPNDPAALDELVLAMGDALAATKLDPRHRVMVLTILASVGPHAWPLLDALESIAAEGDGKASPLARKCVANILRSEDTDQK